MSTFMQKSNEIVRTWYIVDAQGVPLGRTASLVASLLRGKHKPTFTPHVDCGDHVIVLNTDKAVLTGNKLENKYYRHHSGWMSGLKEVKYSILMKTRSDFAMNLAVKGMLPKNTLGANALTRCRTFKGSEHDHAAQKPVIWTQK